MSNTRKATPRKATKPAAVSEDIHALLADPTAGPAERTVPLCLRANLQAEWEQLNRDLEHLTQQATVTMVDRAQRQRLAEQILELEQRMRAATVTFRFRANRSEWARLTAEHPPRKGEDGKIVPQDAMGVNTDTFFLPMLRVMLVEPVLSDDEWEKLLNRLTDQQLDQLWRAAWDANRGMADVPFSRAASRMMMTSEPESRQPASSGSRSNGSRAGSRAR